MRKSFISTAVLCLSVLASFVFIPHVFAVTSPTVTISPGTVGDGYASDDPCGYVMGTSSDQTSGVPVSTLNTGGNTVFTTSTTYKNYQGCVDESGYFYSPYSYAWNNQVGWIDFAWTPSATASSTYLANVDQSSGEWSGYAWNEIVGWIQFDWTCSTTCSTTDRVVTDLSSGDVTGYAWNDQIGWISFYGLTQELPPYSISASVSVTSDDGYVPTDILPSNAPYADGAQYFQVKLILTNNVTGETLTSSDLDRVEISINESAASNVYLNQVTNLGDAIVESKTNPALSACASLSSTVYSCEMTDSVTGETSFNYFIYSGAPTSNMLGVDDDGDGYIDYFNDRAGGTDIYQSPTGNGSSSSTRLAKFYDRQSDRNSYQIDSIDFTIEPSSSGRDMTISGLTDEGSVTCGNSTCEKYSYTPSGSLMELAWRPRFQGTSLVAYYDSAENTTIGDTTASSMYARSYATLAPVSDEFKTVNGSSTGMTYRVHYEAASDATAYADTKFLIDSTTSVDAVMDSRTRENDFNRPSGTTTYYYGYGSSGQGYTSSTTPPHIKLRIGYGTDATGTQSTTSTDPNNPTLEQWVCDSVVEGANGVSSTTNMIYYGNSSNTGVKSCYFTGYLSREDAHADPEDMDLVGAINSSIDESDLSDSDEVSVLGIANYASLRNAMYSQVLRLVSSMVKSQTAYVGTKSMCLGSSMTSVSSITDHSSSYCSTDAKLVYSLMSSTLLYTTEDVYIEGSTSFTDKTLVVNGGNVYIEGNIYGGKLGIIAFKNNGSGGNIYILPDVTDAYVNIFADGSIFSKDVNDASTSSSVYPVWSSSDARTEDLWNQLYIKGTIVSRNTIGAATSDSAASPYNLGDGTTSTSLTVAKEYDLNALREFRLCYPLDSSGNVDESGTPIDCGEGEARSVTYSGSASDAPLIVEYDPPSSGMPVFNLSGLNLRNN